MRHFRWLAMAVCTGVMCLAPLRAATWSRVGTGQFTLLTDGRPDAVREWAVGIEALRRDVTEAFGTDNRVLEPMTILVTSDPTVVAGAVPERSYGSSEIGVLTYYQLQFGCLVGVVQQSSELARRGTFYQGAYWALSGYRPPPRWLISGLHELYASAKAREGRVAIGLPPKGAKEVLRGRVPIPLGELLAAKEQGLGAQLAAFEAESWAWTYFLWLAEDGKYRADLVRYVQLRSQGESLENARAAAFPRDIEAQFERFVKRGEFPLVTLARRWSEVEASVTTGPANDTEVERAMVYIHANGSRRDVAAKALERVVAAAPDAVATWEAQAAFAFATYDRAKGVEYFRRAAEAGSKNYCAYLLPGIADAGEALGNEFASERRDVTVIRKAADELKQAVALSPQPDTYEVFALLIGAVESVNDDDERVLAEARTKWPRSGTFVAGQMGYALRKGDLAGAQAAEALLMDGHLVVSEPAALYARRLQSRLMALQQMRRLDESVQREDFSAASQLAAELQRAPLTVEERQRVDRVRARDASYETLQRVRAAIATKDWDGAEAFLGELSGDNPAPDVKAEIEQLAREIADGKKG